MIKRPSKGYRSRGIVAGTAEMPLKWAINNPAAMVTVRTIKTPNKVKTTRPDFPLPRMVINQFTVTKAAPIRKCHIQGIPVAPVMIAPGQLQTEWTQRW